MEVTLGHKLTEAGVIPEEWEARPLPKAARIANGQVDPRMEPYRSMVLVAPDHIESGTGRLLVRQTASEQHAISGKYVFNRGDVVYSKIRPNLRKAVLVDFDGLCSADMYPLKPARNVAGGFLLAVLLGRRFTDYAESVSVRSGIPKINRAEMAGFVVALPPVCEQCAIATALSDLDSLLDGLERLIAKKRDLKQAAMQQLLTGQTRLSGFSGDWTEKPLSEVGDIKSGGTPNTTQPHFWDGGVPWCTPTDVTALRGWKYLMDTARTISTAGLQFSAAELIPPRSLIMTSRATIGECAINLGPVTTNQGFKSIVTFAEIDVEFLYYLMTTQKTNLVTLCAGSTFLEIGKKQLSGYKITLPEDRGEQEAIATVLSDMDAEIAALEARRDKTRDLKQAMMQELLTGKTRLVQPEVDHG